MSLRPIEAQTMVQQMSVSQREKTKEQKSLEEVEINYKVNPIEKEEEKIQEKKQQDNLKKEQDSVEIDLKKQETTDDTQIKENQKIFFSGQDESKMGNWVDQSI